MCCAIAGQDHSLSAVLCPTSNPRSPLMRKLPVEPVCRMLRALCRRANQADALGHPVRDEEGRFGRSSRSVAAGSGGRVGLGAFAQAGRRMSLGRTVKSRGPGLPTLRSSRSMMRRRVAPVMGANKPGPQGDREAAVQTSARGRPGRPAGPVVPAACIFFCRRATGLSRGPVFPAPSHCRAMSAASPGRGWRRGSAVGCSEKSWSGCGGGNGGGCVTDAGASRCACVGEMAATNSVSSRA